QKEARRVGVSENPLPVHLHERPVRRADDRPELVVPEPYAGEFPEPEETAEGNEGPERRQHEGAKRRGDLQLEPLEAAARRTAVTRSFTYLTFLCVAESCGAFLAA